MALESPLLSYGHAVGGAGRMGRRHRPGSFSCDCIRNLTRFGSRRDGFIETVHNLALNHRRDFGEDRVAGIEAG